MARFKMSEPSLAVRAVDELTSRGYGAGIDVPQEGDTSSFLTAWTTDANNDAEAIIALVREVDRRAVVQHDPPADFAQEDRLPDEPEEPGRRERPEGGDSDGNGRPVVHARRVWGGTASAVIGIIAIGVGLMVGSWWVVGIGVVVLVAGAVLSWSGGGLYDVHATRPLGHEVKDVKEGNTHEGIKPGEMVRSPDVERQAVRTERRRRRVIMRGRERH